MLTRQRERPSRARCSSTGRSPAARSRAASACRPPSLTRLAKPFLDRGLLVELDDRSDGSVGRPVRPLDVAPGSRPFVGVKITGDAPPCRSLTDVRAAAARRWEQPPSSARPDGCRRRDRRGGPRRSASTAPRASGSRSAAPCATAASSTRPFLELGRTCAFAELLEAELGRRRSSLENDLVALAEAERWFGLGRGIPGFVVITIGAGIGYALVVHGEVVRSREAGVGLGGHIPLGDDRARSATPGHRGLRGGDADIGLDRRAGLGRAAAAGRLRRGARARRGGRPGGAARRDEAAADALGRFIALAANLTLQPAAVLAGEGSGCSRSRRSGCGRLSPPTATRAPSPCGSTSTTPASPPGRGARRPSRSRTPSTASTSTRSDAGAPARPPHPHERSPA